MTAATAQAARDTAIATTAAITDVGYFSADSTGKRRGPSVTLDGAVYPFEYDSRVLLDDDGS